MGLLENIYGPRPEQTEDEPVNIYNYNETPANKSWAGALPVKQGLYDPEYEKDACGVGFAAHIKGKVSHKIVKDARNLLCNMTHRGAVGSDARDGDGAGVMTSIPHKFFVKNFARENDVELPPLGQYAAGNLFFKPDTEALQDSLDKFGEIATSIGLRVLGWREVPRDSTLLGPAALSREPIILQPFVVLRSAYGNGNKPESIDPENFDETAFERQLYVLRKRATHQIGLHNWFYLCSLSNKNIVYKGQLSPSQVYDYYYDLVNADYEGHFALVHSRFSTNTFPSWDRAQPLRWAAHNGEINTLRGNKNWMRAREGVMKSKYFGEDLDSMYPIIEDGGSDSAAFDNVLELLVINGVLSLPEAVMLLVPEAWQGNTAMDPAKAAFYEWAACQMEPWDGPALFTFADGRYCGANLDRNGLRPCRYYVTDDDRIVCASEVGTIHIDPERVVQKGRLQPGKMLLVDTLEGRIVDDAELKTTIAHRHPFQSWVMNQLVTLPGVYQQLTEQGMNLAWKLDDVNLQSDPLLKAFGYSFEQVSLLLGPMAADSKEALGSMGNDAPLACLAQQPRLLYEYFRQLFAQVTNPPIDPIREAIVMSLECYVGPQGNLLEMDPSQCNRLLLPSPILAIDEFNALINVSSLYSDWAVKIIDITFPKSEGIDGYMNALDRICDEVTAGIEAGDKILVLSDRAICADRVPVSALLATGLVHHHMVRNKWRSLAALIVETGEAREVHHMCVLLGYGADGICPYLAMECILKMNREKLIRKRLSDEQVIQNYKYSCDGGILKVMSKMGISTLQSYKGAQIFEALGVDNSVVDRCFTGTATRVRGLTFELIAQDALAFHENGFPSRKIWEVPGLAETGEYHWRDGGEPHINDPAAIANIQDAVRTKNDKSYEAYSLVEYERIKDCTLRGLLDFDFDRATPVPIEQVEPWTEIVRRFVTGAMSYGSISMESHSTLALAMNRLGGKSNTGEGGEDSERSAILDNGDTMRSSIKQIASGRFGVTSNYLADADELQIKMAQGAKPGEGGELPGHKVSGPIAHTRHSTPGVGLISPPPHHDIYSIEDLKQLIYDLKCSNPRARVSVKLVSETGVGIVASGVAKAKADHILISGHDGGTGASRWTGIKYAGLPWELGLAETHQTLVLNDLRGRVVVQTDGQIRTGRDVAIACLLGAEEWGFATTPLIAMGCIMMRKCLSSGTPVRTSIGVKSVADINIGDILYNAADHPVICIGVSPPETGNLKEIKYQEFDSRQSVSFKCTPDHQLTLIAAGVQPSLSRNSVTWLTQCDRKHTMREAIDLHLDMLSDSFYHDLVDGDDHPDYEAVHSHIETILDQHYHRGHLDYSDRIDEYLRVTADRELANAPGLVREAMHAAMDRYLEQMPTLGSQIEELDSINIDGADTTTEVFDIDLPRPFVDLKLPSSSSQPGLWRPSSPVLPSSPPASPKIAAAVQDILDDSTSPNTSLIDTSMLDTSFVDSSSLDMGIPAENRFAAVQASLNTDCQCSGFRKVFRTFKTAEQAQLAHSILLGDHHYLIDPFIVRNGDEYRMTVEEYEKMCSKEVKRTHIKLYRAKPAFNPTIISPQRSLLVDPYFLGLWLGDGYAGNTGISSSDREVAVWLHSYLNRLNSNRPPGARALQMSERLIYPAGTVLRNGYAQNVDVYEYKIVCPQHGEGYWANPVLDGLRNLGVLENKSHGIPAAYMQADEDSRLAVIAGLIDSDGTYVKSHNTYRFIQMTEQHKKIVTDLKELALSCGISVTGVDEGVPRPSFPGAPLSTAYIIYLGKGSAKFQHHLLMPRKRMNFNKTYNNHDARPFTITDVDPGEFRAIEVSGGQFQLANRLVVENCHLNTCPVGIATQDPELRKKFEGTPEHVINFFYYIANEMRAIMAKLGFRNINEMVGHAECLRVRDNLRTLKTENLDLSLILTPAHTLRPGVATFNVRKQDHDIYKRLDNKLIMESEQALEKGRPSRIECDIINTDRAMGATLSYEVSRRYGEAGLPKDTIHAYIKGSAGQSFGAYLAPGITLELEGDANDYVGKGLSGGRLIVYPPRLAVFKAEENMLIGNVCLYGATSGTCYFRGVAAERFAVRNSGATAVVEGVGDHGCEYMTGGRVVVLGSTGRNFAAGMSGGIAYVLDMNQDFESKINMEMVQVSGIEDPAEIAFVRGLIEDHHHYTGSELAARILVDFNHALPRFVKVLPTDYKRIMEEEAKKAEAAKRAEYSLPLLPGNAVRKLHEESKKHETKNGGKEKKSDLLDIEESVGDAKAEKKRTTLVLDKTKGFMKYQRRSEKYRNPRTRTRDWAELSQRLNEDELKYQSARCMDCGVPFCQSDTGCPISNIIPKWNELVFQNQWQDALNRLLMTNNFPEFTGRVCPAPCEGACTLGINEDPVGIKSIECAIIDRGFEMGWMIPNPPQVRTGKTVAVIGSGPAGMAAADQLNRAGHSVTVYERADRVGGLLMYGIPNMKLDKKVVQRRVDFIAAEGVNFVTGVSVGPDSDVSLDSLRKDFDSVVIATGATVARDLPIPGRNLEGIHFAMQFLHRNTKSLLDSGLSDGEYISAKGKNVIVIGGGDTGNDCIGTSVRHGAKSVINFELLPQPPPERARDNPWPQWPRIYRIDYGHSEVKAHMGRDPREYCVMSKEFVGEDGHVTGINIHRVEWTKNAGGGWEMKPIEGSDEFFPAELVLLSMGFLGPEDRLLGTDIEKDARKNIKTPPGHYKTNIAGVFAAGDCRRGQSLIVWGINEGRQAAREVDAYLMGVPTKLPVAGGIVKRAPYEIMNQADRPLKEALVAA
ncbi:MAG: glutamate synthase [NADH] [Cirrosporium novae-zelandiae]|nr:MAG: glutamate synthase [NADH] [Cirrosporium novae-zelandiae]